MLRGPGSWLLRGSSGSDHEQGTAIEELTNDERFATVILCTHGDVASTLLCTSLGVPLEQHREVGALQTGTLHELGTRVG